MELALKWFCAIALFWLFISALSFVVTLYLLRNAPMDPYDN